MTKISDKGREEYQLWNRFSIDSDDALQETFWQDYEEAIQVSQQQRRSNLVMEAKAGPGVIFSDRMISSPQLFTVDPNQRTSFLKKLWAYQVVPIAKAFTVAWVAMSVFFSVVNKDGNSYQLLSISAILLLFFIAGIAYHYWVICRPLADMQLIIDRLGIMREGAGLDHLSVKYSEIADIKKTPMGLQICLMPRGRIQEDQESILLPGALLDFPLVCKLLEHHLAFNNKYYQLTP